MEYITHYTNIETALTYIIPHLKLKFGTIKDTNDHYEASIGDNILENPFKYISGDGKTSKQFLSEFENFFNEFSKVKSSLGVCCFETCEDIAFAGTNKHLWTFYASGKQNNAGIALVFNKNKIIDGISKNYNIKFQGAVRYVPREELIKISRGTDPIEMLQYKDDFWINENEFRIIIDSDKGNPPFFIDIAGCIEKIVVENSYHLSVNPRFYRLLSDLMGNEVKIASKVFFSRNLSIGVIQ